MIYKSILVKLNNNNVTTTAGTPLGNLLNKELNVTPQTQDGSIVVLNNFIVPRNSWMERRLRHGDEIEVIKN